MEDSIKFLSWFQKTSKVEGHLVSPATAARLLGTSRNYIHKLAEQRTIKKHYYENQPYIGMNDINKELIKRQERQQRKKVKEEAEFQEIKNKLEKSNLNKRDIIPQLIKQALINPVITLTPENQKKISQKAKQQIEETGNINLNELLNDIIHEIMTKKAHKIIDKKAMKINKN